jgi:hypothetical protein
MNSPLGPRRFQDAIPSPEGLALLGAVLNLRPQSKLASEAVRARMAELAKSGSSLSEIVKCLALPAPDGFGLTVSRAAIHLRLQAAGIELSRKPHGYVTPKVANSVVGLGRRPISAADLRKFKAPKPGRTESWLEQFRNELSALHEEGMTYAEIWDAMAERHPVVPQFAGPLTTIQKTARLAVFVRRQRKKNEKTRRARRSLFEPLVEVEAFAVAPVTE